MTASNQTIVTLYEENDLTPEQIAETQGFDITAVKAVLMSHSAKYRSLLKNGEEEGFSDDEELRARQVIAQIAQYAEDDNTRLRAAMYVRNDKKGRLDQLKKTNGLNLNVVMINQFMQKAVQRVEESKQKIIELTPSETKLLQVANSRIA